MAWLSFVVMVLVFYNPWLGLGSNLPRFSISFTIPILWVRHTVQDDKYISMFVFTLAIWAVLWVILLALERLGTLTLQRVRLRHGFIFAVLPEEVNRLAERLAELILALTVAKFGWDFLIKSAVSPTLDLIMRSVTGNFWNQGGLSQFLQGGPPQGDVFQQLSPIVPLLPLFSRQNRGGATNPTELFPSPLFPWPVLILCILTLVVTYAHHREQSFHFEELVRRNQVRRKYRQRELHTPLPHG